MFAPWRPAVAGLDLLTALFASLNLAYFCYRLTANPPVTPSRRLAAGVLAIASLGSLVEAVALLAIASGPGAGVLDSPPWLAVRVLPLAAAGAMSILVMRRVMVSNGQ